MRTNPFNDSLLFLIGDTDDHHKLGFGGVILTMVFAALLIASIVIAVANWRADPLQRRGGNLWLWLVRVLMGTMWFQGSLWKLPLPVSGGLQYWTGQLAANSAFAWHKALIEGFVLPNLYWLGTLVWLTEIGMAAALMLGVAVRLAGVVGILFTLNLWIGLYRNGGEWPWEYVFIMLIEGGLVASRAGYALGLDALIARRVRGGPLLGLHQFAS